MFGFILFGFVIGAVLGSFANALAKRSLTKASFVTRSNCPKCQATLQWYDLIPVFSYLLLCGKCRYCHKQISPRYLLVELVLGLIVAIVFWNFYGHYINSLNLSFNNTNDYYTFFLLISELIFQLFGVTIFAIVFLTDLEEMIIPDRIIYPAIKIAFIWQLLITVVKIGFLYYFLSLTSFGRLLLPPHNNYFYDHAYLDLLPFIGVVLSGLGIGGFFYLLIVITRGRGMGGGDVKLGALIGLLLGFPNSLLAIMLSFLIGAVVSVGLIILGKKGFKQVVPFGPFLVAGSLIAMLWGDEIMNWYLHLSI